MEYTIRIKKDSKSVWLTGQCEELLELITQGKDLEELMFMMEDAINMVLECKRDEFREQNDDKNSIVQILRIGNVRYPQTENQLRNHI